MAKSPKEELRYLEGKLKQNPDSILFARLADVYLSMNQIDAAFKLCEHGIKKHPYYVTGHYIMSKCYLKKKQFDHAEKELKRVLLFDPQYIAAHRDYGNLMAQIGWNNTCESSYEKILEIDPLNTKAQQKLNEIKTELKLQKEKEKNVELDMDLVEFEEAAIVPNEPGEIDESKEISEEKTIEEFEESFSDKNFLDQSSADEEDEKISFILDDIFRDDSDTGIEPSEQSELPTPEEDKSQFTLEESRKVTEEKSSATLTAMDEQLKSDDMSKQPEPIQSTETDFDERQEPKEKKSTKKKEKIVTPTLGEIYTAQHQYAKAIGVYEILKKNNPDNPIYQQKIEFLKKKLEESKNLES